MIKYNGEKLSRVGNAQRKVIWSYYVINNHLERPY